jgi:hypothetical protein
MKYHAMYKDSNDSRAKIVNAQHEPNDDECDFPSDEESEDEEKLSEEMKSKAAIEEKKKAQGFVHFRFNVLLCETSCHVISF